MTYDVRLRAYEPGGDELGFLPEPLQMDASVVRNDVGALTLTYSRLAAGGDLLARGLEQGLEVAVEVSNGGKWIEPWGCRFVLIGRNGDQVDEADVVTLTLPSYGWLLSKAKNLDTANLLPEEHSEAGKRPFYSESAGVILGTLLDENAARGGVPLTRGWTSADDSAGDPWAMVATLYYELGIGLDVILANLAAQGMADWRTDGRALHLYNADSPATSTDRSTAVRLWLGTDLLDAPSSESLEEVVSRVLIRGDGGLVITEDNPTAPTPFGQWEGYISQGGVSDEGTARSLVQAELARTARVRGQYTRSLLLAGEVKHAPLIDYAPGEWITAPTTGNGERVRVQQITLTKGPEGIGGSVVLNDRVLDAELRRAKRLQGITGGALNGGSGGARPAPEGPDRRTPAAPTGLVVDSDAYIDADGAARGVLSATWAPVTTATDGTLLEVAGYDLAVRENVAGAPWAGTATSDDPEVAYSPVEVGAALQVKVRARGKYTSTPGEWSAPVTLTVTDDVTAPPVPSAPVLSSKLGTITVTWDGETAAGGTMPRDFERVDVVEDGVVVGDIRPSSGVSTLVRAHPTVALHTYALRAVDRSGNVSADSASASITTNRIEGPDIEADSITANELAAGSVDAQALAVDALDFKSATGMTLDAAILTGSIVRTAPSGARTEMTTEGIQVYDQNENLIVDLGANVDTGLAVRNPYTGDLIAVARALFPNENRTTHLEDDWNGWSPESAFTQVTRTSLQLNNYNPDADPDDIKPFNDNAEWDARATFSMMWIENPTPTIYATSEAITPLEDNPTVSTAADYTDPGLVVNAGSEYQSRTNYADGGRLSAASFDLRQYLKIWPRFTPRSGGAAIDGPACRPALFRAGERRSAGSTTTPTVPLLAGETYDISWCVMPAAMAFGPAARWFDPFEGRMVGVNRLLYQQTDWDWLDPLTSESSGYVPGGGSYQAKLDVEFYPLSTDWWVECVGPPDNPQYITSPQLGDKIGSQVTYHSSFPNRPAVTLHSLGCTFYYSE